MPTNARTAPAATADDTAMPMIKVPAYVAHRYGVPRPHSSTVARWTLRGVSGFTLKTFVIGGRKFVRPSDLDAFLTRLNEPQQAQPLDAA